MVKLAERQVILVKNESNYGQDPTPTASANAIPVVEKPKIEFDPEAIERKHPFHSMSKLKPLIGKKYSKISFKVEYFGSGTAITPPRIGDLWEGCGFSEAIGGSDVTYTPASASLKSNTIYSYIDGALYKILGAVGNMKISGKVGTPVYFDFEKAGLYQDDSDSAIITPTFESNFKSPPLALSAVFTLDSITTFVLREFNIDMGIPIIKREDMSAAHGYAGFYTGKRNPTGNIIIEAPTKATYDFLEKFENATEVAASLVIGATAGNKLTITLPTLSFTNVGIEEADGLVVLNIPISINMNTGNDEISLKHW
ncbi:MAG: phage tail tube protein [Candidatus Omnitrophota bacterium]